MRTHVPGIVAAIILFGGAANAVADVITDPANDFLSSYAGPKNGDLDVISAQVFFDGSNLTFTSTENGLIGTTAGEVFVWGINRGSGTQGFPVIAPGVLFDSVFLINPTGTSRVVDLASGVATPINNISVSGATVTGVVPLSALPTLGFAPANYTVNLWPRSPGSGDSTVADFAPNNSNAALTVLTPEPGTMGLFVCMSGAIVAWARRSRLAQKSDSSNSLRLSKQLTE